MAENYTPQGTYQDIQVTGPSQVMDVQVIQATAQPSGVYFELPVPLNAYQSEGEAAFTEPTAEGVNYLATLSNVASVTYTEDLDNNGLLQSYMVATVQIPTPAGRTGPFTTTVQVPIGYLGADPAIRNDVVEPMIAAAVKSLTATAGN